MTRTNRPGKQEKLRPTEIETEIGKGDLKSGVPHGGVRVRVPPPALVKGSEQVLSLLSHLASRNRLLH